MKLRVNLADNPGLKRRLELLDADPLMKRLETLSLDEVLKMSEAEKAAIRQAVDNAIRQAGEEEKLASSNPKETKEGQ